MSINRPPTENGPASSRLPRPIVVAIAFFALVEMLTVPLIVVGAIMPLRDGLPIAQAEPGLFWGLVAAVVLVPALTALYLYAQLRRAERSRGTGGPPSA